MSIERYNRLKVLDRSFVPVKTKTFIPSPTDDDYKRGYITRYFVQKTNDKNAPIIEVNSKGYSNYNNNPFYTTSSLDWVVVGEVSLVEESNLKSIRFASQKLKALTFYLQNLTQFLKK
jgi:N-formylglutamate amidohydrolase